jgi:A/G-specific adenine glycosylase
MKVSIEARAAKAKPALLRWWDRERRDLPWRAKPGQKSDPYAVWLSEILLQQTTVRAVTPYFEKFMALWPDVRALAAASDEDIMRAFAGLGYYSRARNLAACARAVAAAGGEFPDSEAGLGALPGIGDYTAAAIASIAFNRHASPVDGNIARIVTRLQAIDAPIAKARKRIAEAARAMTPADRPGDFAQALMDLGAMVCTPRDPKCMLCPLRGDCLAAARGEAGKYPIAPVRATRPKRSGAVYYIRRPDGAALFRTRPPHGLLGGTVELPTSSWSEAPNWGDEPREAPIKANWRRVEGAVRHVFSHFELELIVYACDAPPGLAAPEDCFWTPANAIDAQGLSSVMRKAVALGRGSSARARQ